MGRPTNKEQKKRKIISTYFKRDSEIYINFEKLTNGLTKEKIIKLFIEECDYRIFCIDINHTGLHCGNINFPKDDGVYFNELYNISKFKHDYYSSLLCTAQNNLSNIECSKGYIISNNINDETMKIGKLNSHINLFVIDEVRLIEIFGIKRVKELDLNGYPQYLSHLNVLLTDEEKEILSNSFNKNPIGTRTIIQKNYGNYGRSTNIYNNSFLVEIDFTQPLEEIQNYIQYLHKEYHNNSLPNIYDFLNIKKNPTNQNWIYKTNHHKDFNILLADKLFIYDSIKMGLTQKYIREELIKYHTKIKKISTDEISENTIREYLSDMLDLIENNGLSKYRHSFSS